MPKKPALSHAVTTAWKDGDRFGPRIVEYYDDGSNEVFDYGDSTEADAHSAKLNRGHTVDYEEPTQDFQSYRKARVKELSGN